VRLNKATPEQILAAAERELSLALKRLVGCRNRVYRETGTHPDDLGAAIFLLCAEKRRSRNQLPGRPKCTLEA
jgi:hypothetical protein